jgi:hypothetical protein
LPAIVLILGGAAIALRNHRNSKDDLLLSDWVDLDFNQSETRVS